MLLLLKTRLVLWLSIACLAGVVAFAEYNRLPERAWFNWQVWRQEGSAAGLNLGNYHVVVEGLPIAGLEENVSALTFDPQRKSLFTVTNKRSELIELSLQGEVLRRIPLQGFGDPEAVEYISPGTYVITDEAEQRLIKVHVDDATRSLDAAQAEQWAMGAGPQHNKGFEGLAYDSIGKRLFVAKERDPFAIYEIHGFADGHELATHTVDVISNAQRDAELFVRDISSLSYDEGSGHLLVLSDESRLVLELDMKGRPVSSLSLLAGRHGLSKTVPQPEGIAMGTAGELYLVSEPNLFYVFAKP